MRIAVLGAIEVEQADARVDLGARKQRALLDEPDGHVTPVAAVERFDGASVVLADGTGLTPDAVIVATGYMCSTTAAGRS
jgi:hypothetical protein